MKVKFWGVRGSIPTPISPQNLEEKLIALLVGSQGHDVSSPGAARAYLQSLPIFRQNTVGGNTSCVEVHAGEDRLIIDAGSGLKELGWSLMNEAFGRGKGKADILISHTHWDHIMGFPFFTPAYVPGNKLTIYGVHPSLKQRFKRQHHDHNFPVPFEAMGADIQFRKLAPNKKRRIGPFQIEPFLLVHPGDAYAFRIEHNGRVFVYASDGSYNDPSPQNMQKYFDFYRNAEVLVFDAHFDLIESFEKSDWGHSTSFLGVDIALHADIKRLVLFHHNPASNDTRIEKLLDSTQRYLNHVAPNTDLELQIAHEGLELTL
ncbi:MAG: MBL fold metallo-hydrolase [bacterium]|nr:MBL fold metallo-hydrolase [bacterium]